MTFKVRRSQCSTCIYREDSPLDLKRLEDEIRDPRMDGFFQGHRACHHHEATKVCCRGFWNRHKDDFTAGQLAQRFGAVEFTNKGER